MISRSSSLKKWMSTPKTFIKLNREDKKIGGKEVTSCPRIITQ